MNDKRFKQGRWVVVVVVLIFGLASIAGFEWTRVSHAQSEAVKTGQQETTRGMVNPSGLTVADQLSNVFADVAQKVNPSVVTIFTETNVRVQQPFKGSPFEQFFGDDFSRRFFQDQEPQENQKQMGLGSGVIVDSNGIILTNNHVVDDADNIKVKLINGQEFEAKVKGRDPQTDLAVITINANNLQPVQVGDSDQARVGEWVLAIGSPFNPQLEHTVTAGIISGKGRSGVGITRYEDYIQTDAAINPGNSGGALVNLQGKLIGINTAIESQTGGNTGVGFAIPSKLAQKVMQDLIGKGKVSRGWLGVYIQDVTPEIAKALKLDSAKGVIVSKVQENSPAEKAGLKEEDVILQFNGNDINNSVDLSTRVAGTYPGTSVILKILRDNNPIDVTVKLDELALEVQQLSAGKSKYQEIGIKVSDVTRDTIEKYQLPEKLSGVVVTGVNPNSIIAEAGFKEGDVILKLNKKELRSVADFNNEIKKVKPGEGLLFHLYRKGGNIFLAFTMPGK